MILKNAKTDLPEHVEHHTTQLYLYDKGDPRENPGSIAWILVQVAPHEIHEATSNNKTKAKPTMYAIVHGPDTSSLRLYPAPDQDYFARFRYCPAAKEI